MNFSMETYGVHITNITQEKINKLPDLVYGVIKEGSVIYYYDRCGGVCQAVELAAKTLKFLLNS